MSELEHAAIVPRGEDEDLVKPAKRTKIKKAESAIILPHDQEIEIADNFVLQAMERAYDPNTNLVRDLKIDDGDLPLAKNFYDYCANLAGKNVKMPFSRQLWIGLMLCGEMCPDCTNPKAQEIWNVPVDLDPHELANSISVLEYGVCPDCKKTKYDFIKEGTLKDYSELVLVGGQRMGKCCTGDTLALTSEGILTFDQIDDLHADSRGTYGFVPYLGPDLVDEYGRKRKPSHFYREAPMPLLTVTLANGMTETGTPEHPIWTLNGWMKLKDLSEGDVVPIKVGQDVWSKSKVKLSDYHKQAKAYFDKSVKQHKKVHEVPYPTGYLDELTATFLGYYVSEGYSYNGKGLSVSNQDADVLDICQKALLNLFPDAVTRRRHNRCGSSNRKVVTFFDALLDGMLTTNARSADIYVPSCILQSPKSVVVAFLRALYEGDGGVNCQRVDYTTLSTRLASQVQVLLANLGIHSWIFQRNTWATNGSPDQVSKTSYTVAIAGEEDLRRFEERIGFVSIRKQKALADELARRETKTKPMPSYNDKLPAHVRAAWKSLMKDIGLTLGQHTTSDTYGRPRALTLTTLTGSRKRTKRIDVCLTRHAVATTYDSITESPYYRLLTTEQRSQLSSLQSLAANYDLSWTTVTSVKKAKARPTYDVSIPEGHRFMANGMLNHNSTFTASLVAYCTHRLFKAPKLSTISRGIQDFTPLTASFVALTATKAQKLLWNPVRDLIGASEWFTDYFKMLDHFGKKYGKEFYQFNSTGTYLRAFHKNLDMYPEGPSKRTLRGPTRWLCIAKGSLVNTDKGLVPIESVRAGLHRTNVGNEWTDVTKTGCMGVKQCLQLETASGAQIILTPDHRVLTYCPDQRSLVWEEARLVPLGGYLVRSVDTTEHLTLKEDSLLVLDRLVSVKPAGLHEVYDIEVKSKLHAFTVQGLVVHNCATDELGHFPYSNTAGDEDEEEDERERANGDEVHQVLTNSLATVRTEVGSMYARGIFTVPQGLNLSISSPASFKDKIMRLYRETQDSDIALGVKAATWEISPLYTRDHPIIQDMYKRNPRKAERDFGANPPSLDSSIFNKELVLPLFQEDRVLSIVYVDHHEKTRAKAVVVKEQATLHPSILALDAGLTNNAFALSLTYKDQTTGLVTGRATLEIVPQPGKKIDFPYVYENVIKVVIATQNVKWVFADRWNSIHILQQIETDFPGVKATQYSLKAKDFANFIEVVGDRKISLGALELEVDRIEAVIDYKKELKNYPNSHLFLQFLTVQLQGGMLYKGGSNTDDLMRALVLGVARHYDAKVSEHMAKFKVQDRAGVSTNAVVLVSGRSGLGYFNR